MFGLTVPATGYVARERRRCNRIRRAFSPNCAGVLQLWASLPRSWTRSGRSSRSEASVKCVGDYPNHSEPSRLTNSGGAYRFHRHSANRRVRGNKESAKLFLWLRLFAPIKQPVLIGRKTRRPPAGRLFPVRDVSDRRHHVRSRRPPRG